MSSKERIEELVREACKNPVLVAIGAACATPSKAASVANALGLSNEDEKRTKAIAVLKRDSQALYGTNFLTALRNLVGDADADDADAKEESTMKVIWGDRQYWRQREKRLRRFVASFLQPLVMRYKPATHHALGRACDLYPNRDSRGEVFTVFSALFGADIITIAPLSSAGSQSVLLHRRTGRCEPVLIRVRIKEFLPLARKLAQAWERRVPAARRVPDGHGVTLIKEY